VGSKSLEYYNPKSLVGLSHRGIYSNMATNEDTHPVYIAKDRKTRVKTLAVQNETSMKDITERFAEHGEALNLHEVPVDADKEELLSHVRERLDE